MKTKNFIITLVALLAFAGNAWAQKDITSQYITNAKLTDSFNVGWTTTNFNGDHTQGNNTEGYAVESYAGWGSVERPSYSMLQNITLPAGHYRLVNYAFYRWGNAYNTDASKSEAYLKAGSDQVKIATLGSITGQNAYANSMAEAANRFETKMYRNVVEFTIASDNTTIEIGVYGTHTEAKSWFICGMFELFDLDDVASVSSPTDATFEITNPGFEYLNTTGWTINGFNYIDNNDNIGGKSGAAYVEYYRWGGLENNHYISQTLTGLENGLYEVTVYGHQQQGTPNDGVKLYANNDCTFIGSTTQDYSVRTTVTNNELTIKIQTEGSTANWTAFDKFRLKFFGDPLQAYKDLLAAKVAEAQALVNGGTLRTGAANQLQTIINDNDNDNDAFTTEAEFNTAVSNIEAGITQANAIAATYAEFDAYKTLIDNLAAGAASSSALTTFQDAVTTANTAVTNATSTSVVPTQIAALRSAGLNYISDSSVTGSFDITFLASQNFSDWKKQDGSAAGIVADQFLTNRPNTIPSFAESYETTCATTGTVLYQTIEDLPAGYYRVGMYAAAMYTSGRGFDTEATEGDANRTFAFAGDLNDASSILRTGTPIAFQSERNFNDLTTLDVNVHLTGSGNTNDLTFGVQKDSNGSNWHFAQIMSIVYSNQPDLTELENTRDALVAEAEGILNRDGDYLTAAQQQALQDAIDDGNDANTFESLNTVTLTTLPDAINTAKQQIAQAQATIPVMRQALERFEQYYNLVDGTDYQRVTMSAKAWTDLLAKVNVATLALDDISQASQYATIAAELNAQMDSTDVSIRLFKSYKAMVEGLQSLSIAEGTTYAASTYMDTDAKEQEAIAAMNDAFVTYREAQSVDVNMAGFLGENLDFSAAAGTTLNSDNDNTIKNVTGWDVAFTNADQWAVLQTDQADNNEKLYIRKNWGSAATTLTASKLKMLPEGDYQLSLSWNSEMTNMTNLSKYALGATNTTIGKATSGAQTLTYDFTVSGEATEFDLVLGFQKTGIDNTPAMMVVDDVELICLAGTPFQRAYDATEAVADNTAAKAAAKSAVEEYADYDGNESGLLENGERGDNYWNAVYVLRNAKTIADNNGDATSLVVNADLMNTTITDRAPAGWNVYYEGDEGGDIWVRAQDGDQVFNIWTGRIVLIDMTQTINNLPAGAYRLSTDLGTDGFREDGSAPLFNFVNPSNMLIGASELVTTPNNAQNRAFGTYTSAAEVGTDHSVTIGVRSEGNYFQMKNIRLEYIGDATTAAAETDASFVRQDFFWQDKGVASGAEINLDNAEKYANASNVKVYPTGVNKIIHGLSGLFDSSVPNADNGGTCANLVITDGTALVNTRAFTATAATYSRSMGATTIWGTLLLPYPLTSDDNVQYYTLTNVTGASSEDDTMGFTPASEVPANTPVVFKKLTEEATSITMPGSGNVTTTAAEQGATSVNADKVSDWTMEGVYAQKVLTETEIAEGTSYYVAQNKFWKATATSGLTINPFRAYFHGPASSAVKSFRIMIFDDEATRIVDLDKGIELGGDIYTLGGQLVRKNATSLEGLPHGTYIIGGKKVFIK